MRASVGQLFVTAVGAVVGFGALAAAPYYEQAPGHHERSAHLLYCAAFLAVGIGLHVAASRATAPVLFLVAAAATAALFYPTTLAYAGYLTTAEATLATAGASVLYVTLSYFVQLVIQ